MNWVDILILVLVLGAGFLGWRNGVIRWAFTLVGGIVGVVLAGRTYKSVADVIPVGDSEAVRQVAAFALVFVVVLAGAWVLARLVKTALNVLLLGWIDSGAGLAVGLVVGGVAASAIMTVIGIVPSDSLQEAVDESTLAEPLMNSTGFVRAFLPEEFDAIKDLLQKGKDLQDALPVS